MENIGQIDIDSHIDPFSAEDERFLEFVIKKWNYFNFVILSSEYKITRRSVVILT
jgi:hypothetical protein